MSQEEGGETVRKSLILSAAIVAIALGSGMVLSQDKKEGGHDPAEDAYLKMHKPGEHHKQLKETEGEWDGTGWVQFDPMQPKLPVKGTSKIKLLHGGRFAQTDYSSDMMGGMTGTAIAGYDNNKKKHTTVWVDSMTTEMMLSTGDCEGPGCKKITTLGEYEGPPGMGKWGWKMVTSFEDKDTMKQIAFNIAPADAPLPEGMPREHQGMEMTYKRKKK